MVVVTGAVVVVAFVVVVVTGAVFVVAFVVDVVGAVVVVVTSVVDVVTGVVVVVVASVVDVVTGVVVVVVTSVVDVVTGVVVVVAFVVVVVIGVVVVVSSCFLLFFTIILFPAFSSAEVNEYAFPLYSDFTIPFSTINSNDSEIMSYPSGDTISASTYTPSARPVIIVEFFPSEINDIMPSFILYTELSAVFSMESAFLNAVFFLESET